MAEPGATAEEAALRERVVKYWNAGLQEWYVEEYMFLAPSIREEIPLPRFVLGRRYFHLLSYEIERVEISGASATVTLRASYEVEIPKPPEGMKVVRRVGSVKKEGVLAREQWVKVGETWYKGASDAN